MRFLRASLLAISACLQVCSAAVAVDYARDVQPILKAHCYNCHGPLRQKSGLRLDHATFIRQGGDNGPALAAKGAESLLVRAVRGGGEIERMPLEAKPLADDEIAKLETWIDEGAVAPDEPLPTDPRQHWSFQKPARPALPSVQNAAWASHPIDRFLAAQYEKRGLTPSAHAPKNLLLRRVYLDLVGVPPTAEELRQFMADPSDAAYQRVVDQLLASPRYGERWGRHWMDVWRYSDWDGYGAEVRESKPHIWRWRDWIIESLNADKPYDEMVREMLAADELMPADTDALRATGFLVRNWYRFNRNVWLEATVEHTSKAFLGITLNCARCHDHMYDPILQTDYYQFRALFEPHDVRTDRVPGQGDTNKDGLVRVFDAKADTPTFLFARGNEGKPDKEHPLVPAVPRVLGGDELKIEPVALPASVYYPGLQPFVQQEALATAQSQADSAESAMAKASQALTDARKALEGAAAEQKEALTSALKEAEDAAVLAEQETLAAATAIIAVKARITADNAEFATPQAANRAELARDASRAHRVSEVETAKRNVLRLERELAEHRKKEDDAAKKKAAEVDKKLADARKARDAAQAALGQPGESYPRFGEVYPNQTTGRRAALARWIASKNNPLTARVAVNHLWMRHFGSPLVPTVFDFGLNGKPPTHPELLDWLAVELMEGGWRMKPIHRLIVTSAAYRMQSRGADNPSVPRDPENLYLWRMNPRRMEAEAVRDSTLAVAGALDLRMFGAELDQNEGLTVPRRSIYFRSSKEKKVTFLEMFDRANVTDCYRRSETVVPHQALAMVNSSLTLAQARGLAAKLTGELGDASNPPAPAAFVDAAFERLLCRPPSDAERAACVEFLATQARQLSDSGALVAFTSGGENPVKPAADPQQRARENLIHVLLNHNDFLTVR